METKSIQIKSLTKYSVPVYPQITYYHHETNSTVKTLKQGAILSLLTAILLGCKENGVTGPPPVEPDMITEQGAREIIEEVFSNENIQFENDIIKRIIVGSDTADVSIDGVNDSLNIRYQYESKDDYNADQSQIDLLHAYDDSTDQEHFFLLPLGGGGHQYEEELMFKTEVFIDSLKALGII